VKRTSLQIKAKIIEVLMLHPGGLKRTIVMYKANLCHGQMLKYFDELCNQGFITNDAHGRHRVTGKGIDFFINIRVAEKLVEINE
jgi:predicted transcriptional regulator